MYTKQTSSYTNVHVEHLYNSGTILWNLGKEGKEKEMIKHHTVKHYIYEGRGHKDMY
jgi:hypothetical protein